MERPSFASDASRAVEIGILVCDTRPRPPPEPLRVERPGHDLGEGPARLSIDAGLAGPEPSRERHGEVGVVVGVVLAHEVRPEEFLVVRGNVFAEPGRRSLKRANLTGRQHLVSELGFSLRLHTAPFAGYSTPPGAAASVKPLREYTSGGS